MSGVWDVTEGRDVASARANRVIFHKKAVWDRAAMKQELMERLAQWQKDNPGQKPRASKLKAIPKWKTVEYITIITGDRTNIVDRPAIDKDRALYHVQYQAFLRDANQDEFSGTTLKAWNLLDPAAKLDEALIQEFAYHKIFTVEQLVSCPDSNVPPMMHFRDIQKRAREYLDYSQEKASFAQLQGELKKRDELIEEQNKKYAELVAKIDAMSTGPSANAPMPKKRGRPAKNEAKPEETQP